MKSLLLGGVLLIQLTVFSGRILDASGPQNPAVSASQQVRAVIDQYCVTCHNQRLKTGGLALDTLDTSKAPQNAETWEKVIRKLRAGVMPPQGLPRPDGKAHESVVTFLESEIDRAAAANPKVAMPRVHRLNRTEYANAIREILGLEIDPALYLPADDSSYGFDNVVSGLQISPALVEGYVSAAPKLSRLALGHEMAPNRKVYTVREDYSQEDEIPGQTFGTRGGLLVEHYFPVDGEYQISWQPIRNTVGSLYGGDSENEQLELTIDGARIRLFKLGLGQGADVPIATMRDNLSVRVPVKGGKRTVGAAFLATTYAPNVYLNRAYKRSILDDNPIEGYLQTPQVSSITVQGPLNGVTPEELPSRQKTLLCRPSKASEETDCARRILSTVAEKAYRRPLTETDVDDLLGFYREGRTGSDFEAGIERGLQLILAHPEFIFRTEVPPSNVKAGEAYRISDFALASRLSFFLWSTGPDNELITLASQGKLKDPAVLEGQVRRMLADSRSEQVVKNFAGQWLQLRTMHNSTPEGTVYPDFDDNLRQAMRTETEMFFDSILHENRSVLELLTADYTFVNERLAVHYGIPNIYGTHFRRVKLDGALEVRRGLLGKGAIQLVTSISDRTSPVQRGKWVLENILGTIPPDPPPNVPALRANGDRIAKVQTMRQRMEEHRANPACTSCHRMMDPLGLALENFDGTGRWRTTESGQKIDVSTQLIDGTQIDGVVRLRSELLRYSPQFVRVVTEKLLTYALGRGVEYDDMPVVRSIVVEAAKNNYRLSTIVLEIIRSAPFQMNRKPAPGTNVASK